MVGRSNFIKIIQILTIQLVWSMLALVKSTKWIILYPYFRVHVKFTCCSTYHNNLMIIKNSSSQWVWKHYFIIVWLYSINEQDHMDMMSSLKFSERSWMYIEGFKVRKREKSSSFWVLSPLKWSSGEDSASAPPKKQYSPPSPTERVERNTKRTPKNGAIVSKPFNIVPFTTHLTVKFHVLKPKKLRE